MLRTLVTGGSGFIGSHLVDRLLARGDHVVIVDDLSTGRRTNLPERHERLTFIHDDLGRAIDSGAVTPGFDEIYHLAAAVGVKLVLQDPIRSIETNVGSTARLLEFAARAGRGGGPCPTLIASSSEVYGKSSKTPFSEDDDVVYGPTTAGRWSYAASKAIDEYLALAFHRLRGLPTVVARFFNTVGPRQVGDYGMVLPAFVSAALAGRPIQVYGTGSQSRCFCDVRDVTAILPTLIATPACHGKVFNVGSDRPISIMELARTVVRVLGSASAIEVVPYSAVYPAGFEDLNQRQPDLARVRAAVGFIPTIPLEQTIRDLASPTGR